MYKAVVNLVKSMIAKAKSVSRNNKTKKKYFEVELLVKRTLDSFGCEGLRKNFFDGIDEYDMLIIQQYKKEAKIEKTLTGWQLTDGKERMFLNDRKQAEYCQFLASIGLEKVKVPKEMDAEQVTTLRRIVDSVFQALNATLEIVMDKKTRDVINSLVIGKIISRTNETF